MPDTPRLLLDQRVHLRDGIELSADVYLPCRGDGPWPAILTRTPYDNAMERVTSSGTFYAQHGYAFVAQDVRGRGDSDGEWEPFVHEGPDGFDTIEWIARQPWCNGDVAMTGISYLGYVQWVAAREQPPHLKALVSTAAAGRWMEELPYKFGVLQGIWAMAWLQLTGGRTAQPVEGLFDWESIASTRPLREADIALGRPSEVWRTWLEHHTFDEYWRNVSLMEADFRRLDLPVLHVTGWFDGDQWGQMYYWHGMQAYSPAANRQWLISGPWNHPGTAWPEQKLGGLDFGPDAVLDMRDVSLRFLDHWLKGIDNGQERDPRARIFAMGRNEWREENEWPPAGTAGIPFYLCSSGAANTLAGNGGLDPQPPSGDSPSDTYTYNPDNPTPSHQEARFAVVGGDLFDNRWRLRRDDVLVYTGQPLEVDVEIIGHPFVVLYASSDCPDTDWHVTLSDVYPDGSSQQLSAGRLRAAYRSGREEPPSPTEPGKVYEYRIELMATCNVWKQGHRIRVTVASADFPDSARNPNSNALPGDDASWRIAHNTVYHTSQYPSHLLAPVVNLPGGDTR